MSNPLKVKVSPLKANSKAEQKTMTEQETETDQKTEAEQKIENKKANERGAHSLIL